MALHRCFSNSEEINEYIIKMWNSVVTNKKDITYILGDITMEKKLGYEFLDRLNGIKHVVLGNHDRRQDVTELLNHVSTVCGMITDKKNKIALSHCPIHPCELQYRFTHNIHGHVHENSLQDIRYINVCCEVIDYKPKTLSELICNYDN